MMDRATTVVLPLLVLALGTASATTARHMSAEKLAILAKQLRHKPSQLRARSTPTTPSGSIKEVPSFDGPFAEGDIVVAGLDNNIYVVNGTSFVTGRYIYLILHILLYM
jgi:hypothetical protein